MHRGRPGARGRRSFANLNADFHEHADQHSDFYQHTDEHADYDAGLRKGLAYGHTAPDVHSHSDSDTDGDPHSDEYGNCHRDTDPDEPYAVTDAYQDSNTPLHRWASDRPDDHTSADEYQDTNPVTPAIYGRKNRMTTELHLTAETQADSAARLKTYRRADEVLAELGDRIPDRLHETARGVLAHFAAKESKGYVVRLALPDEATPRTRSELELLTTLLAELPPIEFADADDDGMQLDLAAQAEITSAWTGRGEKIDYATAVRLAAEKQEAAIHPPDVDPESRELDLAAQAEIEAAWKSRGERIAYIEAIRRVETKRSNR